MKKLIKLITAAASAVVIGGVSCVTTWFSVPASAAGAFGFLEWLEFQTLLQGIGIGGNNSDFADSVQDWIDGIGGVEMPRDEYDGEWMTNYEYYNRLGRMFLVVVHGLLMVGQRGMVCHVLRNRLCGILLSFMNVLIPMFHLFSEKNMFHNWLLHVMDHLIIHLFPRLYFLMVRGCFQDFSNSDRYCFLSSDGSVYSSYDSISLSRLPIKSDGYVYFDSDDFNLFCSDLGLDGTIYRSASDVCDHLNSGNPDWQPGKTGTDNFIGPVYTYPAAQELYKSTGTAAGIRLDVQTQDGVPDIQAALDGAGVETVDDLVAGVAAGTVPMSQVFADARVTPYVVADTTTGTVVTDLGVSATAAGVKSVGLTQDLAVPWDLANAATYTPTGKTWDPDMAKYNLPLFQYFPFCLPWDIYQVLSSFAADPVAPSITIPVGKFFSGKKTFNGSAAANVSATVDLGDDKFSKWFVMLRTLESAGIVIGLVLISVKLIHGGR